MPALHTLGVWGLLLLTLVDSAGLPTGGAPDLVILLLAGTADRWPAALLIASMAVLGSAAGSAVLFGLGRRGGTPMLARFSQERVASIRAKVEHYGLWAVLVAVLAPPPYPMKLFVVSAGVFGMPWGRFVAAVVAGRCLRYFALAALALAYGEKAGELIERYTLETAGLLLLGAGAALAVHWWLRRRKAPSDAASSVVCESAGGPGDAAR